MVPNVSGNQNQEMQQTCNSEWDDKLCKNNPNPGNRKDADKFGTGSTQAQKFLRTKQEILSQYETSMKPGHQESSPCKIL